MGTLLKHRRLFIKISKPKWKQTNPIFFDSSVLLYEIIEEKLSKNSHFQAFQDPRLLSSLSFILSAIVPRQSKIVRRWNRNRRRNSKRLEAKKDREERERGEVFSRAADTIHYDLTVARKRI